MMLKGTSWIHSDYGALFVDSPLIECCFEYFPFECHLLFSLVIYVLLMLLSKTTVQTAFFSCLPVKKIKTTITTYLISYCICLLSAGGL